MKTEVPALHAISHGVRFSVRVPDTFSHEGVRSILPPGSVETKKPAVDGEFSLEDSAAPGVYTIRRDGRIAARSVPSADALRRLGKYLQLWVAERAPDHVFIHSGVAVWNGCAILCPGRSFAGKSTLIWALVQAGAVYYSDEYAVVDRRGHVSAFPVPIALRDSVGGLRSFITPKFGAKNSETVLPSLVLFLRYSPGSTLQIRSVTPADTALRLLQNTVSARLNPQRAIHAAVSIAKKARAYGGSRGDTDAVLEWIAKIQCQV